MKKKIYYSNLISEKVSGFVDVANRCAGSVVASVAKPFLTFGSLLDENETAYKAAINHIRVMHNYDNSITENDKLLFPNYFGVDSEVRLKVFGYYLKIKRAIASSDSVEHINTCANMISLLHTRLILNASTVKDRREAEVYYSRLTEVYSLKMEGFCEVGKRIKQYGI